MCCSWNNSIFYYLVACDVVQQHHRLDRASVGRYYCGGCDIIKFFNFFGFAIASVVKQVQYDFLGVSFHLVLLIEFVLCVFKNR